MVSLRCILLAILPLGVFTTALSSSEFEIFGGSGWTWSTWNNLDPIKFPRKEASMDGLVPMRESFLTGIRLTTIDEWQWQILYSLELNYFYSAPRAVGSWKYVERNADENIVYESRQPNTTASVPLINSIHGLGMIGLRRKISTMIAFEAGLGAGFGGTSFKYNIDYPNGSGAGEIMGFSGQFAARLGAKISISEKLALGIEGRSMAIAASQHWLFPRSESSQHVASTFIHLLIVSFTYRTE